MTAPRVCWRASIHRIPQFLVWITFLCSTFVGLWPQWQVIVWAKQNRPTKRNVTNSSAQSSSNGYAGSGACAHCHAEISKTFSRTRMGRSLMPVAPASLRALPIPAAVYSASLDKHFDVSQQGGHLFQTEYQTGPDGKDVFRNKQQIEWIIGAGANGVGGLVRRGDFLFEAPLSYYSRAKHWDLSPGYELKDIAFNRPVFAGCISCHSGRPRPLDQTTGKFAAEPFSQTAIGCENCHGPGAAHIRAMNAKDGASGGAHIVNPSRLNAELENDICMSCHEAGDSRVLKPGKSYQDFRPGTPLDDTFSILLVPRKRIDADDTDHVQHYYEMSMSQCFRSTAGQLRCATCHDPHVEPTAEETPAYFNQKCMDCHASRTCTLSAEARQRTMPANNCISCHMPERSMPETAHTSLTNHRIVARPGEPWPDAAFNQTTTALPDLVHLNRVPGRVDEIPALSLLEAYYEISERKPEYLTSYRKLLDDLEQRSPDNANVQLSLGRRDLQSGETQRAIEHFERSLQLNPQQAAAYGYLSQALEQRGRTPDAIVASNKAISLAPYDPLLQKALIDQLIAGREYDKAIAAMDHYLSYFPEDGFMRQMLTIAKQ
jgi:hypothetical protein